MINAMTDFIIVNFSFLDGEISSHPHSQLIKYAKVCIHVDDFNACDRYLTAKLFK